MSSSSSRPRSSRWRERRRRCSKHSSSPPAGSPRGPRVGLLSTWWPGDDGRDYDETDGCTNPEALVNFGGKIQMMKPLIAIKPPLATKPFLRHTVSCRPGQKTREINFMSFWSCCCFGSCYMSWKKINSVLRKKVSTSCLIMVDGFVTPSKKLHPEKR